MQFSLSILSQSHVKLVAYLYFSWWWWCVCLFVLFIYLYTNTQPHTHTHSQSAQIFINNIIICIDFIYNGPIHRSVFPACHELMSNDLDFCWIFRFNFCCAHTPHKYIALNKQTKTQYKRLAKLFKPTKYLLTFILHTILRSNTITYLLLTIFTILIHLISTSFSTLIFFFYSALLCSAHTHSLSLLCSAYFYL